MRFYTSYTNRRHKSYGAGILAGDGVHTRGWDAGVRVTAHDGLRDSFSVHMTHGSHESGRDVSLGTVHDTEDGPRWVPADKPGRIPARIGGQEIIAAIPAHTHLNEETPGEFVCVVITGHYGSGTPYFGTVRVSWVNSQWIPLDRQDEPSQTAAVTSMINRAGHGRRY